MNVVTHHPAAGARLASITSRAAGRVIDTLLVLGVGFAITLEPAGDRLSMALLSAAVGAVYEVVSIAVWGQTLGKAALRIRVVSIADRGVPGWDRAAARWAAPTIVFATIGLVDLDAITSLALATAALVVYLGAAVERNRQGLHDMAAGTIVVDDRAAS